MAHRPRKRFGQNFLQDHNVIQRIIATIMASTQQHWVEIGPGQGALTESLLDKGLQLDVVELDRDLVNLLEKKFQHYEKLTIHSGDAQKFDYKALINNSEKLHIIGNLPYNISTPLLFYLLESVDCIAEMVFMLQKEIVDRMCAEPGNKKYGRLTIMLGQYCSAEPLFTVPPESFYPAPKVLSAVVRLTPHKTPVCQIDCPKDFESVVSKAFSQRRKTLRNALKDYFSVEEIQTLSINPALRPEAITLTEYAALGNLLTKQKRSQAS